ncbi:2-oxoglutarate ferredoxin oxidoreductase subunit alpha, partial [Streptomyces sp. UNOC14_S4]|nr:2-oxoglutarate ferredoxin oxidoreductase subunit alpha [Streptomyces sp. UNOC14_S4]
MTSQVSSPAEQAEPGAQPSGAAPPSAAQEPSHVSPGGSGTKSVRKLERVIIRFAGDSGDGMQLTGDRFTSETASFGNDLSTLPNFPAEIRAP